MMGGDISNDSPVLVMVHVDVFAPLHTKEERKFLGLVKTQRSERKVNIRTINAICRNAQSFRGVTLECFMTDDNFDAFADVEDYLDTKGINPFRSFAKFVDVQQVVDDMAYLPNLLGVVDINERAMRYGSKFLPASRLMAMTLGG